MLIYYFAFSLHPRACVLLSRYATALLFVRMCVRVAILFRICTITPFMHANMQHSFFQIYSFTSNIVSVRADIGYHAPRVTNHVLFFARAITQQTLSKKRVQDANQRLFMQSNYLSFENFLQNLLLIHCQHFLADKQVNE